MRAAIFRALVLGAVAAGMLLPSTGLANPGPKSQPIPSLAEVFGAVGGEPLELVAIFDPERAGPGTEVGLLLQGTVPKGQYIYSVEAQGDFSPAPTTVELHSPWLESVSSLGESPPVTVFDQAFLRSLRIHENVFTLSRRYRIVARAPAGRAAVRGVLRYHVCDGKVCSPLLSRHFQATLTVTRGP